MKIIAKIIAGKKDNCKPEKQVVKEEFTGENLTKFGGVGLLRRLFDALGLWSTIETELTYETRNNREFSISEIIVALIYGLLLGKLRPSWMAELSKDKVFLLTAGLKRFPDPSSITRFLSRIPVSLSQSLSMVNTKLLWQVRDFGSWLKEITVDMDSHVTTVFGKQQRSTNGYNPKKPGRPSFQPFVSFIGETRDYLFGILKPGNHNPKDKAWDFLKKAMQRLPIGVRVKRVRADSGFFSYEFLWKMIKKKIEFFVVVPLYPYIQRQIYGLKFKKVGKNLWAAEFEIVLRKEKTRGRKRKRKKIKSRVVVIRRKVKKNKKPKKQLSLFPEMGAYEYQVIATNSFLEPLKVWQFYNQRACCENFIKEGIYSYGFDCVPSHNWAGNCLWFELVFLAYNLMNWFKDKATPFFKVKKGKRKGKKIKRMGRTLKSLLLEIPAQLEIKNNQYVLKLEESWPYKKYFRLALQYLS